MTMEKDRLGSHSGGQARGGVSKESANLGGFRGETCSGASKAQHNPISILKRRLSPINIALWPKTRQKRPAHHELSAQHARGVSRGGLYRGPAIAVLVLFRRVLIANHPRPTGTCRRCRHFLDGE